MSSVVGLSMVLALAPALSPVKALDASCPTLMAGDEIKVGTTAPIYILDANLNYRYFKTGDAYKTYKPDYGGFKVITQNCFVSLSPSPASADAAVTVRPGSRVLKMLSEPTNLYVALPGGIQLISDQTARTLYGSDYASYIYTVSVEEQASFKGCVKPGMVTEGKVHPGMVVRTPGTGAKIWYVSETNQLREVSSNALAGNYFNGGVAKGARVLKTSIYTVPDSAVAGLAIGSPVLTTETMFADRTQDGYNCSTGVWTEPKGGVVTPNQPTSGNLNLSLASANPSGQKLVPTGTNTLVKLMDVNFQAGSTEAVVTGLNLMRSGLMVDSDINNVYIMDGNTVIATNLGITNGKMNFSNPNGLFKIPANTTKKLTFAATLNTNAATRSIRVMINAAADITTSGSGTIGGTFPISSDEYQGTNLANNAGGVQINNIANNQNISVNAGQTDVVVGKISVLGQNQVTQIRTLKFTNIGSVSSGDVTNFKLVNTSNGQQIGSTVGMSNGNEVVFDLSNNPLQLNAGDTRMLDVRADITGGPFRNFQLAIQRNYDVIAHDMQFNFPVLPSLQTGSFPAKMYFVNINEGSLTLNRATTSPSINVLPGGTNQDLAVFSARANGESVRVTAVNIDLSGTMTLASYITNLKLVDDQGQQIGATQATISTNPEAQFTNLNYVIPANATRMLYVRADVSSSATGTIRADLAGVNGEGFTSFRTFTGLGATGNTLTANTSILTVARNSAMASPSNVVAGRQGVRIASYLLQAGSVSDLQISSIAVKTTLTNVGNQFRNLRVVYNSPVNAPCTGTQIGQYQNTLSDATQYLFNFNQPLTVTQGSALAVEVCADAQTGASFMSNYVVEIPVGGVSGLALKTNQSLSSIPASAVAGQNVQTVQSGTLTYFVDSGAPYTSAGKPRRQIGMGTQNVKLASYILNANQNEDIFVTEATALVNSYYSGAFTNYRLMSGNVVYGTGTLTGSAPSFVVAFTGLRNPASGEYIRVPASKTLTLDVVADANPFTSIESSGFHTATQNASTTVRLASTTYQGADSSVVGSASSSAAGLAFDTLRTTLTGDYASGFASNITGGLSTNATVGAIAFTAGSNDYAYVTSVTFDHSYSGASSTQMTVVYELLDVATGQVVATTSVNSANSGSGTFVLNQGPAVNNGPQGVAGLSVAPTTVRTFLVRANLSGSYARVGTTEISWNVRLTGWTWSDYTRHSLSADPAFTLPVNVGTSKF